MNFMELRPMMPHPPAMRRRAHDLPDFPQLLHELPDNIDPMNPIYGGKCAPWRSKADLYMLLL